MAHTSNRTQIQITTGESGKIKKTHPATTASVGSMIPALKMRSTKDRVVDLRAEAATRHLVLFFYPGDLEGLRYPEMSGCTPEACSFRDNVAVLRDLGAEVFGVNLHDTSRQKSFVQREHLNFELLSDESHALVKGLGVPLWTTEFGESFATRTTIIVRRGGEVAMVFDDVTPSGHVGDVISAIEAL